MCEGLISNSANFTQSKISDMKSLTAFYAHCGIAEEIGAGINC